MAFLQGLPLQQAQPGQQPAPQAGNGGAPLDPNLLYSTYRAGAEPITNLLARGLTFAATGGKTSEPGAIAQFAAEMIVPQTPAELAIMLATMGTGGLVAKLGLKGTRALIARVLTPAVAGGVTGQFSDEEISGAVKGLAAGAGDEVIKGLTKWVKGKNFGERVRLAAGEVDAKAAGEFLQNITDVNGKPLFPRINTQDELARLTAFDPKGRDVGVLGETLLKDNMKQADGVIAQLIQNRAVRHPEDPSRMLSYAEAREALSQLRAKAYSGSAGDPASRTALDRPEITDFIKARERMLQDLQMYSPQAVQVFEKANETYRTGINSLYALSKGFGKRGTQGKLIFDSESVSKEIEKSYDFYSQFGLRDLTEPFVDMATRGAGLGTREVEKGAKFIGIPGTHTGATLPGTIKPRGPGRVPAVNISPTAQAAVGYGTARTTAGPITQPFLQGFDESAE